MNKNGKKRLRKSFLKRRKTRRNCFFKAVIDASALIGEETVLVPVKIKARKHKIGIEKNYKTDQNKIGIANKRISIENMRLIEAVTA